MSLLTNGSTITETQLSIVASRKYRLHGNLIAKVKKKKPQSVAPMQCPTLKGIDAMTIDNETESVLRASFKVILGDQYSDEFHLCRLAGLVENRLLTLKSALGDPPNAQITGPKAPVY
jgi:hypothetical protein